MTLNLTETMVSFHVHRYISVFIEKFATLFLYKIASMISQAEANFFGTTNFIFCNKHSQPIMQAVKSRGIYIKGLLLWPKSEFSSSLQA